MQTKRLPIGRLAAGSGVERKTLEQHRKYMVALLLIYTNGHEIIRGHLKQVMMAGELTDEINESTDAEGNIIEQGLSKFKDGMTGMLEKGETLLNQFIETIAIILVTACVIPILVLVFMIWIVQMLFGIKIDVSKEMPKKISEKTWKRM